MYNRKRAQIKPTEKMLRDSPIDPYNNDEKTIWEKKLPHREGDKYTTTEDQFTREAINESEVLEKVLNDAKSYVVHRSDAAEISVPPISVLVEQKRQERMAEDWKTTKKDNWTITYDEDRQQGSLPRFPKNAPQHDKIVLNNDPRRFKGEGNLPINEDQSSNDTKHGDKPNITPLVGGIAKEDMNRVAENIKSGLSVEYDSAIVAILKDAERDSRELTTIEQKVISDLKVARTKAMVKC
jgi:hypothetical protein